MQNKADEKRKTCKTQSGNSKYFDINSPGGMRRDSMMFGMIKPGQ